jgi:hypothetical protein
MKWQRDVVRRSLRTTVLIVGEGSAEQNFLNHVRVAFLARNGDLVLTVKNGHGKGGRAVLQKAIATNRFTPYDRVAVLVDTDVDWGDRERKLARERHVIALESTPCFEAVLMTIAGHTAPPDTRRCKQSFEQHFDCQAHDMNLLRREEFSAQQLLAARVKVPVVHSLLALLGQ